MADRTHLSIGEVLSLLRQEFPDVTISKIRFLESQGLVDPERTPSGYRKFYDHDVERLRWILRQQRENFLPLKIIRGRLTEQGDELDEAEAETGAAAAEAPSLVAAAPVGSGDQQPLPAGDHPISDATLAHASSTHPAAGNRPAGSPPGVPPTGPTDPPRSVPAGEDSPGDEGDEGVAAALGAAAQLALGEDAETYSAEELAHAAGGTTAMVAELQQYGLISPRVLVGGSPYFDSAALEVTRAAAGFARHGVEARHLRAWRNAADREAGLFEQVIMPLLRQRNPDSRKQAAATLTELATLGGDLRKALLDQALRQIR